jgi:predicted acyl esterase
VQNGWLRLSHRKLDATRSTELNPFHSDEAQDMEALTPGVLTEARIALLPFAHQFRAGSRIRLTIDAPGGDRPEWAFDTPLTNGQVVNHIAHDAAHLSRLVLPVLPSGPDLGSASAPCPSLRAQPCRTYVAPAAP